MWGSSLEQDCLHAHLSPRLYLPMRTTVYRVFFTQVSLAALPVLSATSGSLAAQKLLVKDRLHCNAAGYKLWTSIVRPYLKRVGLV